MLERERQRLILKTAEERSVVSVTDLCDLLGASEATIRRDIVAMAERGEIRRVRGGVEALEPRYQPQLVGRPFAVSQEVQAPQKRAIANGRSFETQSTSVSTSPTGSSPWSARKRSTSSPR